MIHLPQTGQAQCSPGGMKRFARRGRDGMHNSSSRAKSEQVKRRNSPEASFHLFLPSPLSWGEGLGVRGLVYVSRETPSQLPHPQPLSPAKPGERGTRQEK